VPGIPVTPDSWFIGRNFVRSAPASHSDQFIATWRRADLTGMADERACR
jgi:hypothetical protein